MPRDWRSVRVLSSSKEIRQYLADVHGLRISHATMYRWSNHAVLPLPMGAPRGVKNGARGLIATEELDAWMLARVAMRAPPLVQANRVHVSGARWAGRPGLPER